MMRKLKEVLIRAEAWPEDDQVELAEYAEIIEHRRTTIYHPSHEELQALDRAERSGIVNEEEVEAAFRAFRAE